MSIYLMLVAAYLPPEVVSNPAEKLALMKLGDSADDETRLARPGVRRLAAWAGVGEKRAITLVTALVKKGLVERVEVGKPGRAAVYRVFPAGVPRIPDSEELEARSKAAAEGPRNKRLAREGVVRAKPTAPARKKREESAKAPAGRGFPMGNPPKTSEQVPDGEPTRFPSGNPAGSHLVTPSVPDSVPQSVPSPQPPTADAAGGESEQAGGVPCSRHRKVARNCRGCGTSARAERERRAEARRESERLAEQARTAELLREGREARESVEANPQGVEAARAAAKRLAREGRERGKYHE
ncbi:helix-turn-helix domain-containing protein [Kitasatospora sp. NPDC057223]|uniref:helix-turn-helix domain-containing protein n=1 Tax=Kitasatospora sp. NPDC057223 TaxID=3346055 RepID=UPI0036327401